MPRKETPAAEQKRTMGEEVAERSTDTHEDKATVFVKEFLAAISGDMKDFDHGPNAQSVVQDAINAGLRVIGDVTFEGADTQDVGFGHVSTVLKYQAPAVPAHMVGAGPTEATSDQAATIADVTSPSDLGNTGAPH